MKLVDLFNLLSPDTWVKVIDRTYVRSYGAAEPDDLYESAAFRKYIPTAEVVSVYADEDGGIPILVIECK